MLHLTNNQAGKVKAWLSSTLFFIVLAIVGFAVAVSQQRAIADWFALRNYQAPATIAQIATQDTMTDQARRIFYVNKPDITNKGSFLKSCPSGIAEQTIVLGCYQSDQAGIFLLNVSDPRLEGVKQVTAAHEMLHAAYDRLSNDERQAINKQLTDYYNTQLQDDRIKKTIDGYRQSEPNDVVNEMHSIFGTEVAQLPAGLESYYKRYFVKRSTITDFSARYQAVFTSRKDKVAADDDQLKALKQQIDDLEHNLEDRQDEITSRQATLNSQRSAGNIAAYNAGVAGYNALINTYNAEVQQTRQLVDRYNQLVNERNAIATEEDQLVKSLSAENSEINN